MLKNIRLSILIGLIMPISTISIQPAVRAATEFCNQTNSPVQVAYARGTFDPRPSIEVTNYQIKGWLAIDPGACTTASTEPSDKVNRPDGYDLVRHYYYTKFASSNLALIDETASPVEKFCVRDPDFQYVGGIGPTAPKPKCDRGHRQVSFSTFYSKTPNYKIALTGQSVPSVQSKTQTFAQWCQQKNSVLAATRLTIDLLLKQAGTKNCKQADTKLNSLASIELYNDKISDLQPLSSLTNLTTLVMGEWGKLTSISDLQPLSRLNKLTHIGIHSDRITNIKPLSGLTNLESLFLGGGNGIKDLNPLASLTNLTSLSFTSDGITDVKLLASLKKLTDLNIVGGSTDLKLLSSLTNLESLTLEKQGINDLKLLASLTKLRVLGLSNNQITDLKPLAGLNNLSSLQLNHNQIKDLQPLAGLTRLGWLGLSHNQIKDLQPLTGLTSVGWLDLSNNQIRDLQPLTGLTNLGEIDLSNNQITKKVCSFSSKSSDRTVDCKF
jgi:internalin A